MQASIVRPVKKPLDFENLLQRTRIDAVNDPDDVVALRALCAQASAVADPRAMYTVLPIDAHGEDFIECGDIRFTSALVAKNLAECEVCVPHVATCGMELKVWAHGYDADFLAQFWAEEIMLAYLGQAIEALRDEVAVWVFSGAQYATMSPGSLDVWPLAEQVPMFRSLGGVTDYIGVTLTREFLMVPAKTISGLFFTNERGYINCKLCPRERCPNRRADYDPDSA